MNSLNFNRPDVYRNIHKALRKALFDFSFHTGRLNPDSDTELDQLINEFYALLKLLNSHGEKEDKYCLPLLESKKPGSTSHNEAEHVLIHIALERLEQLINDLRKIEAGMRSSAWWNFYYEYNHFVSTYLQHMQEEEIHLTRLFYELCSDEELMEMTAKIIASVNPEDMMHVASFMIPALDPAERLSMVGAASKNPQAFQALMGLSKRVLPVSEYEIMENHFLELV